MGKVLSGRRVLQYGAYIVISELREIGTDLFPALPGRKPS